MPPSGTSPGSAPAEGTEPFVSLRSLDVRFDAMQKVGERTELFVTVRNTSPMMQSLGGTNLVFRIGDGAERVENTGRVHAVRGPLKEQMVSPFVLPGDTARLRYVFDALSLAGTIMVTDGVSTRTLTRSAAVHGPAAPEPVW